MTEGVDDQSERRGPGALTPRGTVLRAQTGGFSDQVDRLAEAVAAAGDRLRLPPEMVWAARRLVDLESGLASERAAALMLVVVASQLAQQRGSTRLQLPERGGALVDEIEQAVGEVETEQASEEVWPVRPVERVLAGLEEGVFPTLVGRPGAYRPLIWDGGRLYHHQLLTYELDLVRQCRAHIDREVEAPGESAVEAALNSLESAMPTLPGGEMLALNPLQRLAVVTPVYEPLTLITGGPGTGKTSIVMSLLRLMARLEVEPESMAVAAPTGKAANRLGEAIRADLAGIESLPKVDGALQRRLPQAKTLHRLLGYSPSRDEFRFGEHNLLDAGLVVVDEASMVDLFMMRQLFAAVRPGSRLVLIGDADQLPAVENGAVFRDLIPEEMAYGLGTRTAFVKILEGGGDESVDAGEGMPTRRSTVELERSYRVEATGAGEAILSLADAVRRGASDLEMVATSTEVDEWAGEEASGVARIGFEGGAMPERMLERWWSAFGSLEAAAGVAGVRAESLTVQRRQAEEAAGWTAESQALLESLFSWHRRGKLLCITRVFETGADALNRWCHRRFVEEVGRRLTWLAGEPVMMTQNDYNLDLFNGDMGVVIFEREAGAESGRRKKVAFEGRDGFRLVDLNRVKDRLQRSYAMTVHKSQGSEFDHVGLVLPTAERKALPLLTREILYTGITRARRSVTVFGDHEVLTTGAGRGMFRDTGVVERLTGSM